MTYVMTTLYLTKSSPQPNATHRMHLVRLGVYQKESSTKGNNINKIMREIKISAYAFFLLNPLNKWLNFFLSTFHDILD